MTQTLTPELQKLLGQLSQHLQSEPEKNPPLLEIWDTWVKDLNLSHQTLSDHYANLRSQIVRASPLASETSWLLGLEIAPATFNKKLGYLRACGDWAKSDCFLTYPRAESEFAAPLTWASPTSRYSCRTASDRWPLSF
jgi:hypothetical protein